MFQEKPVFPFSAIINQHALKLALLLNVIDPSIGGALLTGPKGAGKSLTVYALPEILPTIDVVTDCDFNCSPHDPTNMCSSCRSRFNNGKLVTARRKMPLIQIPIGATEDRIIGTLDVEKALQQGTRVLHPGLLSEANQGILYIDEVNLLPDHLIDTIIDAASSGWNVVEREGISVTHPSRFILIGSMNPEEGELRPQILDRFGLHAKAENLANVEDRIRVIQVNQDFRNDPLIVRAKYQSQQEDITRQVDAARQLLPNVHVSPDIITSVSKMCINLKVDGHRPDIVMIKAAKAYAAFHGRDEVNLEDLTAASQLTLTHRTRKSGLTPPPTNQEIEEAFKITPIAKASQTWKDYFQKFISQKSIVNMLASILGLLGRLFNLLVPFLLLAFFLMMTFIVLSSQFHTTDLFSLFIITLLIALSITAWIGRRKKRTIPRLLDFSRITSEQTSGPQTIIEDNDKPRTVQRDLEYQGGSPLESGEKTLSSVLKPENPVKITSTSFSHIRPDERPRRGKYYLVGKRAKIVTSAARGRYVWHELPKQRPWDVAFGPTVRAAAPYQLSRHLQGLAIAIEPEDLRVKMREYRAPFSILLLVDMSLSMATSIANLGRAMLSFHRSVYRRRDRVGLIVFKGSEAVVLQHPTSNLDLVVQKLWKVGTSDFTPMAAGMLKAWKILRIEKQRNKDAITMVIIVSDGITNIPLNRPLTKRGQRTLLSDSQSDVFDVTRLLIRDDVRVIVINTAHRQDELLIREREGKLPLRARWYLPTEFLMELAQTAKGSYYGLSLKQEEDLIKGSKLEQWFYLAS